MEEDIKILEEMKKVLWVYYEDFKIDKDTSSTMKKIYEKRKAQVTAIENLIKGYRKLQDRIIKYEKTLENLQKESIWKSKIKEKIEEIIRNNPKQGEDWDGTDYEVTSEEDFAIEVLQELMEDK
jgi:hypothetical protein